MKAVTTPLLIILTCTSNASIIIFNIILTKVHSVRGAQKEPSVAKYLLVLFLILAVAIGTYWTFPKRTPMEISPNVTGFYRGFGLHDGKGILGKNYFKISWNEYSVLVECSVRGMGFNRYRCWYPSGALLEEGECLVESSGFYHQPVVDRHHVKWAKCYKPDGSLGSEISNGTGVQTNWTSGGTKIWELQLKNYKRVKLRTWYSSGAIAHSKSYLDGKPHGSSISYYESGQKKIEAVYHLRERVGKWKFWNEDGTLDRVEDYGEP